MQFYKTEKGEFVTIETNPHVGLVVTRRESYDVAPANWVSSEATLVGGVLREEDEWGTEVTQVQPVTVTEVIAAWGFDPRVVYWSRKHGQWIFPTETWEEKQARLAEQAKQRAFETRFEAEYDYAD